MFWQRAVLWPPGATVVPLLLGVGKPADWLPMAAAAVSVFISAAAHLRESLKNRDPQAVDFIDCLRVTIFQILHGSAPASIRRG